MTRHRSTIRTLLGVVALLVAPRLGAQVSAPSGLPEPLLRETPWGDFPLERLVRGAHDVAHGAVIEEEHGEALRRQRTLIILFAACARPVRSW